MAKKKAKAKRKTPKRKTRAKKPAKTTKRKGKKKAKAKKPKNLATRAKAELKRKPKSQKHVAVRLTAKQILFVDCYLGAAKRTATLAAVMAGYSEKTAMSQGSQLLHNTHVAAYLKKRQSDIARRLEITEEKVAREMATMAFSKPTDFMRWHKGVLTITDSDQIPDELVDAVSSIEITPGKYGDTMKVKFHDKIAAGKVLAQYLGMLEDKGRANNKGIIIKFMDGVHDQAKALGEKKA